MIVTIIARVRKGNKAFNQLYNIEGTPALKTNNDSVMNFIYWLNETLKKYHRFKRFWKLAKEKKEKINFYGAWKILHHSFLYVTVLNKKIKYCENAGIPKGLLALASFR